MQWVGDNEKDLKIGNWKEQGGLDLRRRVRRFLRSELPREDIKRPIHLKSKSI